MFPEILADNGQKFVIAVTVVLLGLLCLALVLWIIRGRPSSPFIRGGRNRTPRLAVLDAAAIDTRRRLVLVRRDDVEHLVMIGGPTDIVIETRIASATAESTLPVETSVETAESTEPARRPVPVPPVAETPAAIRPAAAVTAAPQTERRPTPAQDGVSAMSRVLYAGEDDARAVPARPAGHPVTAAQTIQPTLQRVQASTQQRAPERRAEDLLEQNRQRVLSPQTAANATAATPTLPAQARQAAQERAAGAATTSAAAQPPAVATDNPALVSEFEKLLEAEIASNAQSATPGTQDLARTPAQPTINPTQTAAMSGQAQPAAKSREETEAEMARLLGEIAANRKA